jgi:ligand-binding sensor domain-containing protein
VRTSHRLGQEAMNQRILAVVPVMVLVSALGFAADGPTIEWEVFNSQNGLIGDGCLHVFEDAEGNIWCTGGSGGVSRFDGTQWTNFQKEEGLISKPITESYVDRKGNVWFMTALGQFSRFDGQHFVRGSITFIRSIFEDSRDNLWIGSNVANGKMTGVFLNVDNKKNMDNFVRYCKKKNGFAGNVVTVILEDSNNILWFGTDGGVSTYDGKYWTSYDKKNGLTSKLVTGIVEDKTGNVWIGTHGGLFRHDGRSWRHYTKEEGTLPTDDVLLLKTDAAGNVWLSLGGHSNVGKMGGIIPAIIGVVSDVGHKSGVFKFDGEKWMKFSGEGASPPVTVSKIEIDSKDNIWCDSITQGIYLFDGEKWTKFSKDEGFYTNHFYDFEEDCHGNIWLATENGLLFYDGQDWTQYTKGEGSFAENVYSVFEDLRGDIWITTPRAVGRGRHVSH